MTPPAKPGTQAVRRMTARLVGVLVVLTAPAWLPAALSQQPALAAWWGLLALAVIGGPALWLVAASWRVGDVRPPAVGLAAGVGVCLLLWPLGVVDVAAVSRGLPWLWLILPMTMAALATVGSVQLSLAYGAVVGAAYALLRVQPIGGSGSVVVAALEALLLCSLAAGPAVLVVGAARAAARLDAIADDAAEASAAASRAAAAVATRRELDAVVHDTVLAALHTAVRDPSAPELPRLAERALDTFSATTPNRSDGSDPVPTLEVGRRLQATLAAVAPDAYLDVRPGPEVPAVVARALVDAALEAARNARRHGGGAGTVPDIGVLVGGNGAGVQVVVSDDGVGFDPSLVAPQRMGLAVSVRERMQRVGGRAEIVTATGSGTTVRARLAPGGHPVIGQLPGRVVVLGIVGFVLVLGTLGAISIRSVTSPALYVVALALGLASVVVVLLPWPAGRERWLAAGVVAAVLGLGGAVVAVLPAGPPGYALWYPAFVWIPLCGLALRGWEVPALLGATLSALTTVAWAWYFPGVTVADGVYRVVSPTAIVVVAVAIARLVRQYGLEVERAHAEQLEAARLSAGARSAEQERRVRLAQIEQIAAPVLVRLRDGAPIDDRLATECRLLEAALRDGIRGRHLVDLAVREILWSARSRGVEVTLLDDSGTGAGDGPPPVADVVRRCTVELVEKLERGTVTVRLPGPHEATLVVLAPDAAHVAEACRETLAGRDHGPAVIDIEHHSEAAEELVVTVRLEPPPATTPRAAPVATATRRA